MKSLRMINDRSLIRMFLIRTSDAVTGQRVLLDSGQKEQKEVLFCFGSTGQRQRTREREKRERVRRKRASPLILIM